MKSTAYFLGFVALFASPMLAWAQNAEGIRPVTGYSVEFLCGGSSEAFQEGVVRGVHATSISLHNPSRQRAVSFSKTVSRALPFQRSDEVPAPVVDTIPPLSTIEVECDEIRMMLPASMTAQFRSGVLAIEATGPLEVIAVYSSRPHDGGVSTIDVEYIAERAPRRPAPEGDIDLTVVDIDLGTLRVRCPTGAGSCRTVVDVIAGNIGTADSGATEMTTTLDPSQSVVVDTPIPTGLQAGETRTFTVQTPPGGNCFDPDCRICAVIDPDNLIPEADETNNQLCRESIG